MFDPFVIHNHPEIQTPKLTKKILKRIERESRHYQKQIEITNSYRDNFRPRNGTSYIPTSFGVYLLHNGYVVASDTPPEGTYRGLL